MGIQMHCTESNSCVRGGTEASLSWWKIGKERADGKSGSNDGLDKVFV